MLFGTLAIPTAGSSQDLSFSFLSIPISLSSSKPSPHHQACTNFPYLHAPTKPKFSTMATPNKIILILLLPLLLTTGRFAFGQGSDAEILLNFKNQLYNDSLISNWNASVKPCIGNNSNWVGIRCNGDGTINKLALAGMGLTGRIDLDSLMGLTQLRTLSLEYNNFEGTLPQVNKLTSLRNLYMSNNKFSGDIDHEAFKGMNSLAALELANNMFTGEIPGSLVGLGKLTNLKLNGNQFIGRIPNFKQKFKDFNVSGNKLVGRIPVSLSSLDSSAFAGNKKLCGKPLPPCKTSKKKA